MGPTPQKSKAGLIGKRDAQLKEHNFDLGRDGILMLSVREESMDFLRKFCASLIPFQHFQVFLDLLLVVDASTTQVWIFEWDLLSSLSEKRSPFSTSSLMFLNI